MRTLKDIKSDIEQAQKKRYKKEPLNSDYFPLDEIVEVLKKFHDKTGIQVTSIDVNYARFSSMRPEEICSIVLKQEKVSGYETKGDIATDGNEKITVR